MDDRQAVLRLADCYNRPIASSTRRPLHAEQAGEHEDNRDRYATYERSGEDNALERLVCAPGVATTERSPAAV